MDHGSAAYFRERERAARRVAALCLATAGVTFGALLATFLPPLRSRIERVSRDVRFGIIGDRERFVRHIRLEADPGPDTPLQNVGKVVSRGSSRGGDPRPARSKSENAQPESRPRIEGPGESFENMLARAMARRSDIPIVLPDQLVIEKLVRPVYPEDAREHNIEGKVSVLALVDTTGAVVSADVVGGIGHPALQQAAVAAVWQCRFRPYRIAGKKREVYVVIPFNFTIY